MPLKIMKINKFHLSLTRSARCEGYEFEARRSSQSNWWPIESICLEANTHIKWDKHNVQHAMFRWERLKIVSCSQWCDWILNLGNSNGNFRNLARPTKTRISFRELYKEIVTRSNVADELFHRYRLHKQNFRFTWNSQHELEPWKKFD